MTSVIDEVELIDNPEPRCPCILLQDTSGSMSGERINAANHGLQIFQASLLEDPLAAQRVEVAVLTFDSEVKLLHPFTTAHQFEPPLLTASGNTQMGHGILRAAELLKAVKRKYREHGIDYYCPWIFMITDGCPTDDVQEAGRLIQEAEELRQFAFFAVGVGEADMACLSRIAVRQPVKLSGLAFQEMFEWLSKSLSNSASQPDTKQKAKLEPIGWGSV